MTKCPVCNKGTLKNKNVPYEAYGILVGNFQAEVCSGCSETFFSEETSKKIEKKEKELGLWGLGFETNITLSGNSYAIRINRQIAKFMGIKKGEPVFVHPEGKNKLVVELE